MTPSFADRIDSLIQTMSDVVLPAIEADKPLEREQAQLVLAHLRLIHAQLPWGDSFDRQELAAAVALGEKLLKVWKGGPKIADAAHVLEHALASAGQGERQAAIRRIHGANEYMVRASRVDGTPDSIAAIRDAVLKAGAEQTFRERVFFADSGFDADRNDLPKVETIFTR